MTWRDPRKRGFELPYQMAAAVAVMQMGVRDFQVIAAAVGLSVDEIAKIDRADDDTVRHLAISGFPPGERLRLREAIRCPRCRGRTQVAPCALCECLESHKR